MSQLIRKRVFHSEHIIIITHGKVSQEFVTGFETGKLISGSPVSVLQGYKRRK